MAGTIEESAFLYANNDGVRRYVDQSFGGLEKLRKDILVDFFRHAFDGSGADNFFDAGSCIGTACSPPTSRTHWASRRRSPHVSLELVLKDRQEALLPHLQAHRLHRFVLPVDQDELIDT